MADNVSIDQDGVGGVDFVAATDEIAGNHYQKVKLVDGTADSTAVIPGDATNGLWVNVKALPVLGTGSKVQLTDGTSDATVRNLAANDALNVAIVDGSGNQVTSFGGSGGTSSTDDADFTPASTAGTPIIGVYESSPTSVTDNDMGIVGINATRSMKVSLTESTLDVAHDAVDTGQPVKVGGQARSSLPTAVSNADRANFLTDLFGRQLIATIDPGMQVWKSFNATAAQTGTVIWTPASGKKIAVTHLQVTTYGTTAGRVILFFDDDTTYNEGTDQVLFKGSFAPSTTSKPGALPPFWGAIYSATADYSLRITTDAALSIDVVAYGFEF